MPPVEQSAEAAATKPLDEIPQEAFDRDTTPLDYIIVGAGPGGGPLAARLAEAGMNVLVLEAGEDPGDSEIQPNMSDEKIVERQNKRPIYYCPGYHAAATEPDQYQFPDKAQTSWEFNPVHFTGGPPVFYPRATGIGGCSAHHAMIAIYGLDSDWQDIADLTGDLSWLPGYMRAIYQRIERLHYPAPSTTFGRLWLKFRDWFAPDRNRSALRGDQGWLDVTYSDPNLALKDSSLLRVVTAAFFAEIGLPPGQKAFKLLKQLIKGNLYRDLDLNDAERMRSGPEGIALVPLAVSPKGVRRGPRELLLETRWRLNELAKQAARERKLQAARQWKRKLSKPLPSTLSNLGVLRIATGIFVTKVILQEHEFKPPRAIGVEFRNPSNIYGASKPKPAKPNGVRQCYCKREVILCGGAFNTPQLLMLSGIGNARELKPLFERTPNANKPHVIVDLPGVGRNLQDRCEVSIVSQVREPFSMLNATTFSPDDSDLQFEQWTRPKAERREGLYTNNGAAIAILKRSGKHVAHPDLLILGFPAAFRGYYSGWSKELFHARKGDQHKCNNLWSWVILKAKTTSRGTVKLQSLDPLQRPDINFRYFDDKPGRHAYSHEDMQALIKGIAFLRRLNASDETLFVEEIQPGTQLKDDSAELRDWVHRETWGHHACGTCRMGKDQWQADPSKLLDKAAVVDSKFRVHGVVGLRIVDASIFPKIPGYFLVVPVYMISEKAAVTILNELSH